jgi:hypothetical protein
MRAMLSMVAVLALAGGVTAQEEQATREREQATPEAAPPGADRETPRPAIRVLQHPYEISSFYRSGESRLGPWAGLPSDPAYGIADFYRSRQSGGPGNAYGWSAFWTSGYRTPRPAPLRPYRRTIGENGDLFLAVPFLAPVGPISGAFFGY